MREIDEL